VRCLVTAYEPGEIARAIINLSTLTRATDFVASSTRFAANDSEDVATRTARRAKNWTPATLFA
jgi:hypothetical protein